MYACVIYFSERLRNTPPPRRYDSDGDHDGEAGVRVKTRGGGGYDSDGDHDGTSESQN